MMTVELIEAVWRDHHLAGCPSPIDWQVLQTCPSSNTLLMQMPIWQCERVQAIIACHQSAGRGQRGRVWHDQIGQSLMFSLGLGLPSPLFPQARAVPPLLTLLCGLTIAETLNHQGFVGVKVKWPNDILWKNRKLAGILIEQSKDRLVIGVGINVLAISATQIASSRPHLLPVSLAEIREGALDRTALLCALVANLIHECQRLGQALPKVSLADFAKRWQKFDALKNAFVDVVLPDGTLLQAAKYLGVEDQGGMRLMSQTTPLVVHSAHIVHMAMPLADR